MITKAAGVLFLAPGNKVLFLKRGPLGDHPGEWCFPGGKIEAGETPEEAAVREAIEEAGPIPPGTRTLLARSIQVAGTPLPAALAGGAADLSEAPPMSPDQVDFTTFLQRVGGEFAPVPDDEHVGFAWAPANDPPQPTHPGCAIAIEMLSADELGIARAMAAGRITSPQRYKNVTLWAIRITGTGVSYRPKIDEYVLRNPDLYLNEEFLARCNGLAVVMYHPKKSTLDSESFEKSIIGTVMLPYIKGSEVWGIAKVYDDEANASMSSADLSTSPGVVLAHPDSPSYKMMVEDGTGGEKQILVEGKPSLLDHVAICALGVWDKGGDPAGIINDSIHPTLEDTDMPITAEEKKEITDSVAKEVMDAVRKDAADRDTKFDATLDKVLKGIDSVGCRLDSFEKDEKARKDAAEEEEKKKADAAKLDSESEEEKKAKADAAKKDADEKEEKEKEEKEKADAAHKDAAALIGPIADRLAAVEKNLPMARTDSDRASLISVQAKFDPLYHAFGDSAPSFMNGETVTDYRIRLATNFKEHSPVWKAANLAIIAADAAALDAAEQGIFADAMAAALTPATVAEGDIRMVPGRSESGHRTNRFVGDPRAAFARFTGSRRALPDMTNTLQKYSAERRAR